MKTNKLNKRGKIGLDKTIKDLIGEIYDELAAKMVVALYREKTKIINELKYEKYKSKKR